MSAKKLNAIIGHLMAVSVACAIMMWSVFNTWLNVLAYRASDEAGQSWGIASLIVIVTCVIPFLLGLFLLFRTLGKSKRS